MPGSKSTTVYAVSSMANALASAQGVSIVITLEDVRAHMDWLREPGESHPVAVERTKFIIAAMNFLLSENAPTA